MIPTIANILRGLADGSMSLADAQHYLDEHLRLAARAASTWAVINSAGAVVAENITHAEALDYLTDARLARGWTAVSVIGAAPAAPAPQTEPIDEQLRNDPSSWWALVMGAAACLEDATYCLASDPDALRAAQGAARHYREQAHKLHALTPQAEPALLAERDAKADQIIKLMIEIEAFGAGLLKAEAERDALAARVQALEAESLRVDAERYRWLRDSAIVELHRHHYDKQAWVQVYIPLTYPADDYEMDAAIDDARGAE